MKNWKTFAAAALAVIGHWSETLAPNTLAWYLAKAAFTGGILWLGVSAKDANPQPIGK